jgi:hypothetical protein
MKAGAGMGPRLGFRRDTNHIGKLAQQGLNFAKL